MEDHRWKTLDGLDIFFKKSKTIDGRQWLSGSNQFEKRRKCVVYGSEWTYSDSVNEDPKSLERSLTNGLWFI